MMSGGTLRHPSPEGGTDTIGYGHKLSPEEQATGRVHGFPIHEMDEENARKLLRKDVARVKYRLSKKVPGWKDLDRRSKEMLMDFEFNLGDVRKFPKFYLAVLEGDIGTQRKEYIRKYRDPKTGNLREIKGRNDAFYKRYLSDEALKKW